MFDTILVPLDGSPAAERALPYVALLPSRRVRLLQVFPDITEWFHPSEPLLDAWRTGRADDAADYLWQAGAPLRQQGRQVDETWAFGDPAAEIVAAARDADLIAMTTHGRGLAERVALGSVADRVARHAATPTLLVRAGDHPVAGPPIAQLVVPLDGSPLADQALPVAADLAALLRVPVRLIRALDVDLIRAVILAGPAAAAAYAGAQADLEREAVRDLDARAATLRQRGLAVTTEIRRGAPIAELLDAIQPADLVVLTSHGRGGVGRWLLGSVAEQLVRRAAGPVLLLHARPIAAGQFATESEDR
ncbi:MAG TPA: universal stress protein [Thermomicrobiales bacterium]|nr:universal stress protein [Thermomicrobiales bacterium]